MKKCSRCGAVQKNSRMNCIDCGAPLGKPLDDKSEAALEAASVGAEGTEHAEAVTPASPASPTSPTEQKGA